MVILPDVLSAQYGLNQVNTGLCFLPLGFGALLGSPIGGKMSDIANNKFNSPGGILVVSNVGLVMMIPTLIVTRY
jgi:predicted MFS family arabinose efflux permease